MAPWNEALFADDLKANALLPPFISAVLPLLRRTLPSPRYEIYLNFFNNGRNWAEWMSQQTLDESVIAELHIYHAFDPMAAAVAWPFAATSCPMCTDGEHGMRSLVCKTCGDDGGVLAEYERRRVPFVIGEWSLGTCGMWGDHPATLTDPDFLYTFFAAARSTFVAHGARADFFWTAVVRTDGYDPTAYASDPQKPGSRAAVMREAREMAQTAGWAAQNQYVAPIEHAEPLREDYLLNWHLGQLARTNTSDGHRVVLPPAAPQPRGAADGSWAWAPLPLLRRPARWLGFGRQAADGGRLASRAASEWLWGGAPTRALAEPADGSSKLRVDGPCAFQPPAPQTVASAMAGTCEVCAPEGRFSNMLIYSGAALALLSLAALWCRRERTAASQRLHMLSTPLLDDGPSSALKSDEQ
ncbi:hypothetical protein AB1Y20_016713 [Prymnesium parvum]|uniref:Glycoside hydrolase family 5 domain-containing protein n=1 Tax=Prymnesium parvum TaxID=97485 RepID=A0AB34IBR6_PRYPA